MQAYMTMSMNHDPFIVDQVEKRESAKDSALSLSVVLFFNVGLLLRFTLHLSSYETGCPFEEVKRIN